MRHVLLAAALPLAFMAVPLHAQVVPTGTPGSLPPNSFGGSGIPTDAVMLGGADGVTIGLSATQRYTSPTLTNDGAGTFYANTGISTGAPINVGFAAWNFDYYVGNAASTDYFTLFFDLDPSMGTSLGSLQTWAQWTGNNFDSTNLGYANYVSPGVFDPNTPGEYSFALYQYADAERTQVLSDVAINVEVTATPEPATLVMMATGVLGLGLVVRRRRPAWGAPV